MTPSRQSIKQMLAEAKAEVSELSAQQVIPLHVEDDVVIVDLRDSAELASEGRIPGSYHAPRGSLEFLVDPDSPLHNEIFASGKHFIFHCAGGGRSALAARTARQMGLAQVSHLEGGLAAWKEAGGPIELDDEEEDKE